MNRVINRVIPNFVALCNKLVFFPIFTRVRLKIKWGRVISLWVASKCSWPGLISNACLIWLVWLLPAALTKTVEFSHSASWAVPAQTALPVDRHERPTDA